jgi:hypothetical protein
VLPPRHTIEVPPGETLPPLERADPVVAARLSELFGRRAVQSQLVTDSFVNRFAATVDNLARAHASPSMWPVERAPGRFAVETVDGRTVIAAQNAERYTPFVALVERMDLARAVDVYSRLYPLFQRAYEMLGYPTGYFNARLVQVIDHLLQAPEPAQPVEVRLLEVQGPAAPFTQPWLHYEFADPALESLSAGQKLLVRVGPDNARRLKARLAQARGALTGGAAGASR